MCKLNNLNKNVTYRIKSTTTHFPKMLNHFLLYKNGVISGYIRTLQNSTFSNAEVIYDIPGIILPGSYDAGNIERLVTVASNGQKESFRIIVDAPGRIIWDNTQYSSADTIIIPINLPVQTMDLKFLEVYN